MRVLLTGSSGWLGRHLTPRLRVAGHVVAGLDIVPGPDTSIVGTVADRSLIARVFSELGIEVVIHSGALHKPDIVRFRAQSFVDTNVTGTLNLLEAAVAARHDRFVFTSTSSLMISDAIRNERGAAAVWLDESSGPLEPRNIYGVTKMAGEGLCRLYQRDHGLACVVLRTGRFFPEDDDTNREISGPNLKANEFLNRRLTVEDAADAHLAALKRAPELGFEVFVVSASSPFDRRDAERLKRDAREIITRHFPDAAELYARRGWKLPTSIGRVYDPSKAERLMNFRAKTDFGAVLDALRHDRPLPFAHDPTFLSPSAAVAPGVPAGRLYRV